MDENLIGAKKEIETILYDKLGETLNEKYKDLEKYYIKEKHYQSAPGSNPGAKI